MILKFNNEYAWLSNFAPCLIELKGIVYQSVEHAYMSAKFDSVEWKSKCADINNKAGFIKKESYKKDYVLVDDWEIKKIIVMYQCLRQKFNQEPYKTLLLDTGDKFIQEGNWHDDVYWGFCLKTGEGQNILGKMIMEIRSNL